jgi:hypothetical protein
MVPVAVARMGTIVLTDKTCHWLIDELRSWDLTIEARGRKVFDRAVWDCAGAYYNDREGAMSDGKIYTGSCFCGEVRFEVSGEPAAMGYCHCESCRHWSAGPVNAFTLWKPEALKVTHGAASIGSYNKTPISYRKWCTQCGGHLFTEHPTMGLVDIYAAMIPRLTFEPGLHVHYQETVLHIPDGKPKMKDMPKEMGGSGVTLAD